MKTRLSRVPGQAMAPTARARAAVPRDPRMLMAGPTGLPPGRLLLRQADGLHDLAALGLEVLGLGDGLGHGAALELLRRLGPTRLQGRQALLGLLQRCLVEPRRQLLRLGE